MKSSIRPDAPLPVDPADVERISWVVGHHHTYTNVDGLDHQILLEADFLVNADESGYARAAIETARSQIFQTVSGIRLLDAMYPENVSSRAYNEIVSI